MIRIGDKVDIFNGYAFKSSKYVEQGIRIIRITNVQKGEIQDDNPKFYPSDTREELKNYLINEGDILMSLTGNVGRVGVFPKEFCPAFLNQRVARIRVKCEDLFQKYLFYILNSEFFERDAIFNSSGIAQLNLSTKWVSDYEIPLPPLLQQKKIAAILDAADAYRQKTKALIEKYDELTQSLFLDMFGDPVTNQKGWRKIKLEEIGEISSGSTPSRKNVENFNGDIPWVKTGEVNSKIILDTEEKISISALRNSSCKIYPAGSLIIAMYGQGKTRGQVGLLGIEACTNQACAVITKSDKANFMFLYKLIQMSYDDLRSLGRGGNQPNLNSGILKKYLVINPPIDLQSKFAERVQAIETQKAQAQASLAQSEDLFNSLLQRAFKGELTS